MRNHVNKDLRTEDYRQGFLDKNSIHIFVIGEASDGLPRAKHPKYHLAKNAPKAELIIYSNYGLG